MKAVAQSSFIFSYHNKPHPIQVITRGMAQCLNSAESNKAEILPQKEKGENRKETLGWLRASHQLDFSSYKMTFWSHLSSVGHPDKLWALFFVLQVQLKPEDWAFAEVARQQISHSSPLH